MKNMKNMKNIWIIYEKYMNNIWKIYEKYMKKRWKKMKNIYYMKKWKYEKHCKYKGKYEKIWKNKKGIKKYDKHLLKINTRSFFLKIGLFSKDLWVQSVEDSLVWIPTLYNMDWVFFGFCDTAG